ncbi:MAG: SDR family NAD(P)-dependent oxidoreductase, partial [Acidimicrobiales bacterium]|nr:SDR family NAD(P)-dependent oxidoreductase [Acidimicrobiales bacterium]
MRLEGKVAVITGGGNGLGRATALRFASEGAQVVVADILDELGEETTQMVNDQGGVASFVHCDAVSANDNYAMAAHAVDSYGALDILVTAAGVSHPGYKSGDQDASVKWFAKRMDYFERPADELLELDLEDFRQVMSINLDGTLLAAQACGAHMVEAGKGSMVTIASIAAKHPDAGPIPYVCSKS